MYSYEMSPINEIDGYEQLRARLDKVDWDLTDQTKRNALLNDPTFVDLYFLFSFLTPRCND